MADQRLLSGRYALGRLLGTGGMADVYEGTDTLLGRTVAVKMLRADLARDATFLARFRREAQSAASLSHPNIVAVHDTGVDDAGEVPIPFIVMEYVDGPTLRDLLNERGTIPPDEAYGMVADVCSALDYSHQRGIVHRDIKPGNVMVTSSGMIKVMDFGIARAVTSSTATMTQTSTVLGTAHYLSPEQARGEPVDSRSDIYSTGVLLYELLTGVPPFSGETPVAIAYQHVRENPELPSARNPELPPTADAIVMKAMSKNPDNRYQTGGEMRTDLLAARSGQTLVATPVMSDAERTAVMAAGGATAVVGAGVPLPEEDAKKKRSGPVLLILGAVAVIAAVLVGFAVFFNRGDIEVPDLIGKSTSEAERLIEDAGLTVGSTRATQVDDPTEVDQVLSQDPNAGRMVADGTPIDYEFGTESETVEVPDVTGQSLDDARTTLTDLDLRVGTISRVASTADEDEVLSQNPAAGSEIPTGSAVALEVASGESVVPNVIGKSENEARSTLSSAGFSVTKTTRETSASAPGTVVDQQPSPETPANPGSTVNIVVAEAAPEPDTHSRADPDRDSSRGRAVSASGAAEPERLSHTLTQGGRRTASGTARAGPGPALRSARQPAPPDGGPRPPPPVTAPAPPLRGRRTSAASAPASGGHPGSARTRDGTARPRCRGRGAAAPSPPRSEYGR